jgi:coenzyme PQQ precursor peptide PqqA
MMDLRVADMTWTQPVFEEIALCCEINSYASAKL